MSITVNIFKVLPKHNGYGFVSDSFALNWYNFAPLAYKNLLLLISYGLK